MEKGLAISPCRIVAHVISRSKKTARQVKVPATWRICGEVSGQMSFDEHGDIYAYLIPINVYKAADAFHVVAYLMHINFVQNRIPAFSYTVARSNHEVLNHQCVLGTPCGHLCCPGISIR